MKLNLQLKTELTKYEKILSAQSSKTVAPFCEANQKPQPPKLCYGAGEKVAGGDVLWKPVDRASALLLARAPWWAHPPQLTTPKIQPKKQNNKPKKERKHMNETRLKTDFLDPNGKYESTMPGVTIHMINGVPMFSLDEVHAFICAEIAKLPRETSPAVKQAEDTRKIIDELLHGIGGDMEKFRANVKVYMEDIRQTRFSVVRECAEMTKELKDVRQFFLGADYKEQVARLNEFVVLCEKLRELKTSGFLDSVADTMLRLS